MDKFSVVNVRFSGIGLCDSGIYQMTHPMEIIFSALGIVLCDDFSFVSSGTWGSVC